MPFVLHKDGRSSLKNNSLYRNAEGQTCVWMVEDNAELHIEKIRTTWERWRVRPADSNDYVPQRQRFPSSKKSYVIMDGVNDMPKKSTSIGCLVDVFEDYELRKFAIASKAGNEDEFLTEVANALGRSLAVDWTIRLRELLPLIVDMCCKYRGYKADTVQERRELVAGDLEMPRAAS